MQPLGLQHASPSPTPRACSNSCPSSQWCHPTISASVIPFSCLPSCPASGSFPMSSNKPEYHKINVLLIPNVAWTNGLGPVPACATCFRQCPLYTFSERLFPTDLHLLDGVVVGRRGGRARPHPCLRGCPWRVLAAPRRGWGSGQLAWVAVISSGCLE